MVAPIIATIEYTTIKGFTILDEKINSAQRAPYNPQPIIVENAKHLIDVKISHFEELGNETLIYAELVNEEKTLKPTKMHRSFTKKLFSVHFSLEKFSSEF
mgnify:CR=1 FL=1